MIKNAYTKEILESVIKISQTKSDALRKLGKKIHGGNFNVLTHYIEKYGIDTSHFVERGYFNGGKIIKQDLSVILIENSDYQSTTNLKRRLYNEGLKTPVCEKCGQDEWWHGEKISLILDHINGNRKDNRIENLRIVCPNCEGTLETHCRGNRYHKKEKINHPRIKKINHCSCGKEIVNEAKMCQDCYNKSQYKVERPPYEVLLNEVKIMGYCGTGRKYGVSDNAIRKWVKLYEKNK